MRYAAVKELVRRELNIQSKLSLKGDRAVLNVPGIFGPVGLGKTALCFDLAVDLLLEPLVINLGESSDASDTGIPAARFKPLTIEGPSGDVPYTQWMLSEAGAAACAEPRLLLFDDIDKAPPAVQGALLSITGNRMFRDYPLHPGTLVVCAGNRVGDDELANSISESLRTRITPYEISASYDDFAAYGISTGQINQAVIGYLSYAKNHVHSQTNASAASGRFATPRGWREVSQHMAEYPDPRAKPPGCNEPNWKLIVSHKCGSDVGNDFWAWYEILSKVDLKAILKGDEVEKPRDKNKLRMWEYAAVFAVAWHCNKEKLKPSDVGITTFLEGIGPEMKVAFMIQLNSAAKHALANLFPKATASIMAIITRTDT